MSAISYFLGVPEYKITGLESSSVSAFCAVPVTVKQNRQINVTNIKEIRLLLKERLKSPQHSILVSSHNLTEIAAVTDVLIFIRGGKIIKVVENDYNEKELEALYEDIMTSGQREEA